MATNELGIWTPGNDLSLEQAPSSGFFRTLVNGITAAIKRRGVTPCLSTERPATNADSVGQFIYETDTGFTRVWTGDRWMWVAGDSHVEFRADERLVEARVGSGPGDLVVDGAVSSPDGQRPAGLSSNPAVILIPERGLYQLQAIVGYQDVVPGRMFLQFESVPSGTGVYLSRDSGYGDSHASTRYTLRATEPNTMVVAATYHEYIGTLRAWFRIQVTRLPG